MKNLPIVSKFLAVLGIFGVFVIAVAFYATSQITSINSEYTHLRDGPTAAEIDLANANSDIHAMLDHIAQLMLDNTAAENQTDLAGIADFKGRFSQFMDQAAAAAIVPANAADMVELKSRTLQAVDGACANSIQLGSSATTPAEITASQAAYLSQCAPQFPSLVLDVRTLQDRIANVNTSVAASLAVTAHNTVITTFILILGGLVVIMLGGFFAVRGWVVSPIQGLQGVMGKLAGGDLQARVTGTDRRDEIGGMARAVEVFKEAGIEKQRLEAEATAQRAAAEQERQRTEAERAAAAKQQEFVVHSVATGLEKLSNGDLLFRLTEAFSSEYEKLRGDFNAAMETLQGTMQSIAVNTQGVRSGAEEITQASDDLSRRTEQQAASLEETAAALDQITATVRRTAEVANEARDLVSTSKTDAERSGDVVRQTVGAMDGIESSSKQIANIIGVIDEIAFQTNLLALNAGVEAARAGDAGRGFAVVATEVRALAQRSADAAKEIKTLISASGQQVETGVKLVSETGNALGRIVTQVTQLNGLVVELAASAKEQATGLGEVNAAVNQMDQVTQQNAAMVEQATAASHGLSGEAHELVRLVGQFRIGESVAAPVLKRAVPKTPPKKRVVTTSANKVAMLPRQDEAKQPAVAGAAEDWREF
ncbi:methyl-accepting chemotaxis protein [Acidocella sp.]|jgi:methyl-accepting chemotaxis protein|uniref:methyl-accepting chemotaxis protein n=1 Tax=Acidocella sp. TaxID=50710 RepID=UPI002F3FAB14